MLSLKNMLAAAGLAAIIAPHSALAASEIGKGVTYHYQGNSLELFRESRVIDDQWVVTEGSRILRPVEAYFVFNDYLPANSTINSTSNAVQPVTLLEAGTIDRYEDKAYKDLHYWAYGPANDPENPLFGSHNRWLTEATFTTDEAGNIKTWSFAMGSGGPGSQSSIQSRAGVEIAGLRTSDGISYSSSEGTSLSNWNVGKPGIWTVTPAVPELGSQTLMLFGLLGVAMTGVANRARAQAKREALTLGQF